MIEVNIWENWIIKQVGIKFDSLKIDNSRDAGMSSDATYHPPTLKKIDHYPATGQQSRVQ